MEALPRKISRGDSNVRASKNQNTILLEQNKKLMEQLEQMSKMLPNNRSITSSSDGAIKDTSSDEEEVEGEGEGERFLEKSQTTSGRRKTYRRSR